MGLAPPIWLIRTIFRQGIEHGSIEQKTADHLPGKAAILEKARPLGQGLVVRNRFRSELGIVHLPQQVVPLALVDLHIAINQLSAYPPLLQIPADTYRTLPLVEAALNEGFGETFVALQAVPLELVEDLLQQIGIGVALDQFVSQLPTGVLTGREQSDCRGLDLNAIFQAQASASASSSSASLLGSSSARIRPSISSAISGFSLRKLRTFSLPWPIRSPL